MRPDSGQVIDIELLQIVEVPKSAAVRCQHEGCQRPVYKRIHILRIADEFSCVGSDCFKRFYQHTDIRKSKFSVGGGNGVPLSEEQARLLEENTFKLLEEIRERYANTEPENLMQPIPTDDNRLWHYALSEAQRSLSEEHPGVNLGLPGFSGLIPMRAKKIFRRLKREQSESC